MVFDALDFLTFVQDDSSATVEAYDFSVDNLDTTGVSTNVFDLGAASPNYLGQSLYIKPREDVNGALIDASTDTTVLLVAELYDGATTTPAGERATATQVDASEMLEIPLPQDVKRYVKILIKSDGGAGSASILKGAAAVWIGESGLKE